MDGLYDMTEDQQSLVELIRDFMTREVKPHVLEWEKEGHYPKEIIQMGIDMGLHMMQVPEEYGGMGLDTTTTAMMPTRCSPLGAGRAPIWGCLM